MRKQLRWSFHYRSQVGGVTASRCTFWGCGRAVAGSLCPEDYDLLGLDANQSNWGRQATERRALRRRRTPNSRENLPTGACQALHAA